MYKVHLTSNDYSVKIVADSITEDNDRIITYELEYPRMVHSELMTHRLFSRNAMSSRAIPVSKMIEQVIKNPAKPTEWGKNQAGMQSAGEHQDLIQGYTPEEWWKLAALSATRFAQGFADEGYHKQVANRLLEPFQRMKTVLTATEFENFFWLRCDGDADPTIKNLADIMYQARQQSTPQLLLAGEYHVPYVQLILEESLDKTSGYFLKNEDGSYKTLSLEEALAISSSCCAQVSYRTLNNTYDKAMAIYERLLSGAKVHASPFEHQATPMIFKTAMKQFNYYMNIDNPTQEHTEWEKGITHCDRNGDYWSGNFKGFIQHRQLLDNHVKMY